MQPQNNQLARSAHVLWLAFSVITFLAGLLFLAVSLLGFKQVKPLADALARDRSLDSFTPILFASLIWGLHCLAILCLLVSSLLFFGKVKIQNVLNRGVAWSPRKAIRKDLSELKTSLRDGVQEKTTLYALAVVTLLGIFIRLIFISQPMLHDEAYTFVAFASRSLWTVISDYELPNNHIFHTILVYLVYHLLGDKPWVIRLPALTAGVLCIPATYLVGTMLYNRKIALVAAALTASAPAMIEYSTNARGYTLISLFTLLILACAVYVKEHRNLLAWGAIIVFSSLGFYTIPIMLYPFGMIILWLLLSTLFKDTRAYPGSTFLIYLIASTICVGFLSALLYVPVFLQSGIQAVVANNFVRSLSYEALWESLGVRAAGTRDQWLADLPLFIGYLSLAGLIASILLHRRLSTHRIPLQIAAVFWIGLALFIQRVAPQARIWLFLLPLYLLWTTAGIAGLMRWLIPVWFGKFALGSILLVAIALPVASLASSWMKTPIDQETAGVEEDITLYLKSKLQPGDLVVIQAPMATPLLYYFRQYEIPVDYFDKGRGDIQRAYVIVSSKYSQTLEGVLNKKGLGERFDLKNASPVYHSRHITIYEVTPNSSTLLFPIPILRRWSIQGTILRRADNTVDECIDSID